MNATADASDQDPATELINAINAKCIELPELRNNLHILFRPTETWVDPATKRKESRAIRKGTCYANATSAVSVAHTIAKQRKVSEREKANVYFGVCPRFGRKHDLAWQIRVVPCLWVDIDNCSLSDVQDRLEATDLPVPSAIVNSGNGVHVYWFLETPYLIDDVGPPPAVEIEWVGEGENRKPKKYFIDQSGERINLTIAHAAPPLSKKALFAGDVLQGLAKILDGDHTQDLTRLLAVVATFNRKDQRNGREPKLRTLVYCYSDRRYPIEQFATLAENSPGAKYREKIAKVPLPVVRKLTPAKEEKLRDAISRCSIAEPGQRSELDFNLCCLAIRKGVARANLWNMVHDIGKFAEAGERYFDATWHQAENEVREQKYRKMTGTHGPVGRSTSSSAPLKLHKPYESTIDGEAQGDADERAPLAALSNAVVEGGPDGEVVITPLTMAETLEEIRHRTGSWPRRVGTSLFVHDEHGVSWLNGTSATFGFLSAKTGRVDWHRVRGCVSKDETHAELQRTAQAYRNVEEFPHEPKLEDHYYACTTPEPGDGAALGQLLAFFTPETETDRALLVTMLLSMLWGGMGGTRPAFVITSTGGRGRGKTKTAEKLASVFGGALSFSHNEDINAIKTRLLSPDATAKRVAILDNVKSLKFSWGELEALITTPTISGKKMYVGEGSRPNVLTWVITLNGASLSTDMAQRSAIIYLKTPNYSGDWETDLSVFVEKHRWAIIADLILVMRGHSTKLTKHSRWGLWERDVLSRLPDPDAAQGLILERQAAVDVESDEAELIDEYFEKRLLALGYNTKTMIVHIPTAIAAQWFCSIMNTRERPAAVTKILKQQSDEGKLQRIKPNPCKTNGRGFLWWGDEATSTTGTNYDLELTIEAFERSRQTDSSQFS